MMEMSYPGGKGNSYHQIINQIPPHSAYIEPFLGHGAVMRAKKPASINIGIDKHLPAVRTVMETISGIPGSIAIDDDCGSYRQKWRNGRYANSGDDGPNRWEWRWTPDPIDDSGDTSAKFVFIWGDALDFFRVYQFTGDEYVYCDPPYLLSTRKRLYYEHELASEEEHAELLGMIKRLPCKIAISGYWSDLYSEKLRSWRSVSWFSMTRGGELAQEFLWMNYQSPDKLHEYTYLGSDFRERERIKRKAKRWVSRFQKLPHLERKAIISELDAAGIVKCDETAGRYAHSDDGRGHRQD